MRARPLILAVLAAVAVLATPSGAAAHPLGNFTINHYSGIRVSPEAVAVDHVIDMAEIPAFAERRAIDADGDGGLAPPELLAYAGAACDRQAASLALTLNGMPVALRATAAGASTVPGQGGLDTLRLTCRLEGAVAAGAARMALAFHDESYPERLGWREIVVEGDGIAVGETDALTASRSDRLLAYPNDLLERPLDQSAAEATFAGPAPRLAAFVAPELSASAAHPAAEPDVLDRLPGAELGPIRELVAAPQLNLAIVLAGTGVAVLLGAYHALTPGHGKTVMAAYLVGTRGRPRDALLLGLAVTVAHTLGVLALALVTLLASSVVSAESLFPWLTVISGATMVAIGGRLLLLRVADLRRDRWHRLAHAHDRPHEHGHANHDAHRHEHGHAHDHAEPGGAFDGRWRSLFALGLSGGLVPSASALLLLLGSVALERPLYGVLLIVAFGAGMALVLSGVGLVLVRGRTAASTLMEGVRGGRWSGGVRLAGLVPGAVVLVAGAVIAFGAVQGLA